MLGKCREGFRLLWRFKPSTCGSGQVSRGKKKPHRLDADTIALTQRLAGENRLWGAERIRGELVKLGIHVAKRSIQKYMRAVRTQAPSGQSWSIFLKTHGQDIWACEFVPVVTLSFQTLYVFVIVDLESRRLVPIYPRH